MKISGNYSLTAQKSQSLKSQPSFGILKPTTKRVNTWLLKVSKDFPEDFARVMKRVAKEQASNLKYDVKIDTPTWVEKLLQELRLMPEGLVCRVMPRKRGQKPVVVGREEIKKYNVKEHVKVAELIESMGLQFILRLNAAGKLATEMAKQLK